MAVSFLSVHQAANDLLTCVCQALDRLPAEVPGLDGCPCRTGVVPGEPAADNCGEGCEQLLPGEYPGQLTVNVVRTYLAELPRYTNLSAVTMDGAGCGPGVLTVVDLAVTLWRCVPGVTGEGCPPAMSALGDSAMQLHADMTAITQAVLCCYPSTDTQRHRGRRFSPGPSVVLGPRGDCVGIRTLVTVALDGTAPPIPSVLTAESLS